MGCCVGAKYDNWCDGEEIVYRDDDDNGYCIFHAPAEYKEMPYTKFNNKVRDLLRKKFNQEKIDLRGIIFPDSVKFSDTNLTNDFRDKTKHPSLDFSHSVFGKDLFLLNVDLYGEINLSNCTFNGRTKIFKAYFERKLLLNNSIFYSDITINDSDFQSIFNPTNLFINNNSLSILNCSFESSVIIKLATNPNALRLLFSSCQDVAVITENLTVPIQTIRLDVRTASENSVISLQGIFFKKLRLPKTLTFPIFFSKCLITYFSSGIYHFQTKLTFSSCKFQEIYLTTHNIEDINFCGCSFPRANNNRIITTDAHPYIEISTIPSKKRPTKTYHYLEDLYRKLKQTAQTKESGMESSDWHFWEKYFAQKRLEENNDRTNYRILQCYEILSGYGECVKKASIWLVAFLFIPFFISFLINNPMIFPAAINWKNIITDALNYIPLATRAPKAAEWERILQILWQILITFQATLLGFALRNRYRR